MRGRSWFWILAALGLVILLAGVAFFWVVRVQLNGWDETKYPTTAPPTDLAINVVGRRFEWGVRYPRLERFQTDQGPGENIEKEAGDEQGHADGIHVVNELHVWKDADVAVRLRTEDEPHGLVIPTLRIRAETLPAKTVPVRFKVTASNIAWNPEASRWEYGEEWEFIRVDSLGAYQRMRGKLNVHETKEAFLKWLEQAEELQSNRNGGQ